MRSKIKLFIEKSICMLLLLVDTGLTRHSILHHFKPFEPLRLANILSHIESDCSAVMIWLNRWLKYFVSHPGLSRIRLLGTRSWITTQDFNRNIGSFTLQIVDHSVLQHQTWFDSQVRFSRVISRIWVSNSIWRSIWLDLNWKMRKSSTIEFKLMTNLIPHQFDLLNWPPI